MAPSLFKLKTQPGFYFLCVFFFQFEAVAVHTEGKLQRITGRFLLVPCLKLTEVCTKETGKPCIHVCILSRLLSFSKCIHSSNTSLTFHTFVMHFSCAWHLFLCKKKKKSNTAGNGSLLHMAWLLHEDIDMIPRTHLKWFAVPSLPLYHVHFTGLNLRAATFQCTTLFWQWPSHKSWLNPLFVDTMKGNLFASVRSVWHCRV